MKLGNIFRVEQERLVLLDDLHELVFNFKLEGHFFYVNSTWINSLGYTEAEAKKMTFMDILQDDQIAKWRKVQQRLGHGAGYSSVEFVFRNKRQEDVIVEGSLQPVAGEGRRVVGILQNITSKKQAEKERDRLFVFSIDMLGVIGYDGFFKRVNPAFVHTLGFPEEDFLNHPFLKHVHYEDYEATVAEFAKLKNGIPSVYFENRYRHSNNSYRWLSWTAHPVPEERLIYAVARDVTRQREMKDKLKKMAFSDPLTNIYNRRGFFAIAANMLKIAQRKGMGLVVMIADFDRMKYINDHFGHHEGDAALIAVTHILRQRFRNSDAFARIGGDEFAAAFLSEGANQSEVIRQDLDLALEKYNLQKFHRYPLSLSMGFSYAAPDSKASVEELVALADDAMYEDKRTHPD